MTKTLVQPNVKDALSRAFKYTHYTCWNCLTNPLLQQRRIDCLNNDDDPRLVRGTTRTAKNTTLLIYKKGRVCHTNSKENDPFTATAASRLIMARWVTWEIIPCGGERFQTSMYLGLCRLSDVQQHGTMEGIKKLSKPQIKLVSAMWAGCLLSSSTTPHHVRGLLAELFYSILHCPIHDESQRCQFGLTFGQTERGSVEAWMVVIA